MPEEDFIPKQIDLQNKYWVDSVLAQYGHPHILGLIAQERRALKAHTLCHIFGLTNTPEHEESVKVLAQADKDLARAWAGIYN